MKEGHVIFTIPRSMILSTRTCVLPQKFGLDAWKKYGLHQGWAGLILCMMWEAAQGSQSKWSAYLGRWDPYQKRRANFIEFMVFSIQRYLTQII